MKARELIILFPEELPQAVVDKIEELKSEVSKVSHLALQDTFRGTTWTGTLPYIPSLFNLPDLHRNKSGELLQLKNALKAIQQLELVGATGFPGSDSERLHPVEIETSQGTDSYTKIEFGGVVYERVTTPANRPADDTSLLPWQIKVGGVVYQRGGQGCA